MKGILLAGGIGSRLWPSTQAISKHLIPIYDKPMIFYPLSVLMLAEIREVVIVSTPEHKNLFESLFGTGRHLGMEISHVVQPEPKGIADAILCVKEFIGENSFCLILGDNIFYGPNFREKLLLAKNRQYGATIFG
ncbi:MAG: sugar phosphate nucleotidyltransferase, partial [Opitutae bacterium]